MNTLRIVGLGLLAVAAILIAVTIHVQRDHARKMQGLKILREMTPETLIANCGRPTSDTDALLGPRAGWALTRVIKYKTEKDPYWVNLEFRRERNEPWRLSHFSASTVGVSPSDDNAYIAIPVFPCMAKKAP